MGGGIGDRLDLAFGRHRAQQGRLAGPRAARDGQWPAEPMGKGRVDPGSDPRYGRHGDECSAGPGVRVKRRTSVRPIPVTECRRSGSPVRPCLKPVHGRPPSNRLEADHGEQEIPVGARVAGHPGEDRVAEPADNRGSRGQPGGARGPDAGSRRQSRRADRDARDGDDDCNRRAGHAAGRQWPGWTAVR